MKPGRLRMEDGAQLLAREIDVLLPRIRGRAPNAADHLERSAEAVLYNIAEGNGAFRPKVKINAYEIARKEATELRAILRRLVDRGLLARRDIDRAYNIGGATIAMLTRAMVSLTKLAEP